VTSDSSTPAPETAHRGHNVARCGIPLDALNRARKNPRVLVDYWLLPPPLDDNRSAHAAPLAPVSQETNVLSNVLTNVNPKRPIFAYTFHMTDLFYSYLLPVFTARIAAAHRQQQQRFAPVFPPRSAALSEPPALAPVTIAGVPAAI
jgi:hypothetical protein